MPTPRRSASTSILAAASAFGWLAPAASNSLATKARSAAAATRKYLSSALMFCCSQSDGYPGLRSHPMSADCRHQLLKPGIIAQRIEIGVMFEPSAIGRRRIEIWEHLFQQLDRLIAVSELGVRSEERRVGDEARGRRW